MAGITAGKTWSRIGAEVAPTDSAASGVWGDLNEVAENIGAGTWPAPLEAYQFIAQYVADNSAAFFSFTSVPQDYRSLRIVMANGQRSSSADGLGVELNGDSTMSNYGYGQMYGTGTASNFQGTYNAHDMPYGDIPATTGSTFWMVDISNYSNASVGTMLQFYIGSSQNNTAIHGMAGMAYSVASAITNIEINSGANTTSGYYFVAPTVFTLFGIGSV